MENARYRLGPVRVFPKVSVANAGYNTNVFGASENEVGDWEATATAGARFLLPFGKRWLGGTPHRGSCWPGSRSASKND